MLRMNETPLRIGCARTSTAEQNFEPKIAATGRPVDAATAAGKAFFDMLGVFAEFGTTLRGERQDEGISAAKAYGVHEARREVRA